MCGDRNGDPDQDRQKDDETLEGVLLVVISLGPGRVVDLKGFLHGRNCPKVTRSLSVLGSRFGKILKIPITSV